MLTDITWNGGEEEKRLPIIPDTRDVMSAPNTTHHHHSDPQLRTKDNYYVRLLDNKRLQIDSWTFFFSLHNLSGAFFVIHSS